MCTLFADSSFTLHYRKSHSDFQPSSNSEIVVLAGFKEGDVVVKDADAAGIAEGAKVRTSLTDAPVQP